MIDIDYLKRTADLLGLIESATSLKRVANTGGGEWAGSCPFCGGTDRFRVQPNGAHGGRWMCRKCTNGRWGDVMGYVMTRDKCDFLAACERLGVRETRMITHHEPILAPQLITPVGPPPESWQAKAKEVIDACQASLWSDEGARAREWLHSRGLTDETLQRWKIGWCAGGHTAWRKVAGLSVPCGIVIPCEVDGVVWYIKTRRAIGSPKYQQVKGGRPAMFGAQTLRGHRVAVICEGEFDALLLTQEAGELCGVATLGSATNGLDILTWGIYLLPVVSLLIAYDLDGAGKSGATKLSNLTARARRVTIPAIRTGDKDITDFHNAGGRLRDWLTFELARLDAGSPAPLAPSVSKGMPVGIPNPTIAAHSNATISPTQPNRAAAEDGVFTGDCQQSINANALRRLTDEASAVIVDNPPISESDLLQHLAEVRKCLLPVAERDYELVTALYLPTVVEQLPEGRLVLLSATNDERLLVSWERPKGQAAYFPKPTSSKADDPD